MCKLTKWHFAGNFPIVKGPSETNVLKFLCSAWLRDLWHCCVSKVDKTATNHWNSDFCMYLFFVGLGNTLDFNFQFSMAEERCFQ